jgi:UDP-N-acetylglucosamine diphosphorylase/glucosamine-1-phosphate N-acetyltransferase
MDNNIKAVVLAAGKGTRLQTEGCDLPKVMREALGKPLVEYVLQGLSFIPRENITLVVGYKREKVMDAFPDLDFAFQKEQLGTGHAVMSARDRFENFDGGVLVCCGDMPLIRKETYKALADIHMSCGNDCTILSGTSDDNLPYGRIVRDSSGQFLKMVEEKDCTPEEKNIRELNSGVYMFNGRRLAGVLDMLRCNNAQGEYYLTDAPKLIKEQGGRIGICCRELGSEIIGVNTAVQLEQVENILKSRNLR